MDEADDLKLQQSRVEFIRALQHMSSLRNFGYEDRIGFNVEAWKALAHVSATLESIWLCLEGPPEGEHPEATSARWQEHLDGLSFQFPRLKELSIINFKLPGLSTVLRHIVTTSITGIRTLTLNNLVDRGALQTLFRPRPSGALWNHSRLCGP